MLFSPWVLPGKGCWGDGKNLAVPGMRCLVCAQSPAWYQEPTWERLRLGTNFPELEKLRGAAGGPGGGGGVDKGSLGPGSGGGEPVPGVGGAWRAPPKAPAVPLPSQALPMASPKQSPGVGPPDPVDVAALQPETMLCDEREEAAATPPGPAARVAAAASGLRCKAFLVLAVCLSATALLHSLGSLATLPPAPLRSPASQRGTRDSLDLLKKPVAQQRGRVLVGSVGAPGCLPGVKGDVAHDVADVDGWSQGTLTTGSPVTARTLPQWQPGSRHGGGRRLGTAVAVARWLGTGVPATLARLLQAVGDPSPRPQHPFVLGSLHGAEPGSGHTAQVPVVTSAHGLGARVPLDAPVQAGALVGTPSQSYSTADQMLAPGASPAPWTTSRRADLSLAASSAPPAEVTASRLPSGAGAVTAGWAPSSLLTSERPVASGFSDVQHRALAVGATTRSCNGQKEEERPSPGLSDLGEGEDHAAAPHRTPLPVAPSALPAERTSSLAEMHPGAAWSPSAVTPEKSWDTGSAGTSLHGKAALLVGTILAKVPGNGSGLLATVLTSFSSAVLARDVGHPQGLAPFLPPAGSGGSAVSSEIGSDDSSLPAQQTLLTSPEAHPSPAWTRVPSAAGPAVTGMSLAVPNAIPEPGVTKTPSKDGAAVGASPPPRDVGVTQDSLGSPAQRPSLRPDPFLPTASEDRPAAGRGQAVKVTEASVLHGWVAVAEAAGHSESRTAAVGSAATPAGPSEPTYGSPGSLPPPSPQNPAPGHCSEAACRTGTTSLLSPSYLPTSTRAASTQALAAPPAVTLAAQSMSSPSATSQHPSTAGEHLPAAAEEAFTLAELMVMGDPDTLGVTSPASHLPGLPFPVRALPLEFQLTGITYSPALSDRASESYRELEGEVRLTVSAGAARWRCLYCGVQKRRSSCRGEEPAGCTSPGMVCHPSRWRRGNPWHCSARAGLRCGVRGRAGIAPGTTVLSVGCWVLPPGCCWEPWACLLSSFIKRCCFLPAKPNVVHLRDFPAGKCPQVHVSVRQQMERGGFGLEGRVCPAKSSVQVSGGLCCPKGSLVPTVGSAR